jgi:methyltransferase (TIGR00027 family)
MHPEGFMGRAAANTGIMPTALVAIEQSFPKSQRVIDDPLAFRMLPFRVKMFVRLLRSRLMRDWLIGLSEKSNPGIWGGLLCRKRYIDEKVMAFRSEIDALVSLGAGFDTRLFRLPGLSDLPIWEIDQRENIEAKEKRLRRALGSIPTKFKLVTVDFDRDDLGAVIASRGYSSGVRVFFLWEAVTQYLTEQGVRATFDWLGQAQPGSRIIFSYVRKGFLTARTL